MDATTAKIHIAAAQQHLADALAALGETTGGLTPLGPGGTVTLTFTGSGRPYPLAQELVMNWQESGKPLELTLQPHVCYAIRCDVPPHYTGTLSFYLFELAGGWVPQAVEFWMSASPNGDPIPGTHYAAPDTFNGATLGGPEFGFKPAAGPYWFNLVLRSTAARIGVRQDHQ